MQEVRTGRKILVSARAGINGAPSYSRDDKKLALTLSGSNGNLDVYLLDLGSQQLTRVTDDPGIDTEASFAALCGTSPVPVSSGRSNRHRLNRAGDRQANAALWRIVIVRLRSRHAPTTDYLERRVTAGNSKRDAIRCLKRYLARELYNDIQAIVTATQPRSDIAA